MRFPHSTYSDASSPIFKYTVIKEAPRLPSTWPSHLHNKCSNKTCLFPNPPQAAEGTYNCQGYWREFHCQGTYYVSRSMARELMKRHEDEIAKEREAILKAEERARRDVRIAANLERRKAVKDELDEFTTGLAAAEVAAKYEERRKMKNNFNGSTSKHLPLTRRPAQRKPPTDTTLADLIPDQDLIPEQEPPAPVTYEEISPLALYPPAVTRCCKPLVDPRPLNHSPQMSSQTSYSSQGTGCATKHPAVSYEYNSQPRRPKRSVFSL